MECNDVDVDKGFHWTAYLNVRGMFLLCDLTSDPFSFYILLLREHFIIILYYLHVTL